MSQSTTSVAKHPNILKLRLDPEWRAVFSIQEKPREDRLCRGDIGFEAHERVEPVFGFDMAVNDFTEKVRESGEAGLVDQGGWEAIKSDPEWASVEINFLKGKVFVPLLDQKLGTFESPRRFVQDEVSSSLESELKFENPWFDFRYGPRAGRFPYLSQNSG